MKHTSTDIVEVAKRFKKLSTRDDKMIALGYLYGLMAKPGVAMCSPSVLDRTQDQKPA